MLTTLVSSGCGLERWFPAKVADGAARLSILQTAAIVKALYDDDVCGLSSKNITSTLSEENKRAVQTQSVRQCRLNFGTNGKTTGPFILTGSIIVDADLVIKGMATSLSNSPVMPSGDDPVTVKLISVLFDNFTAKHESLDEAMTVISGILSANITVHVAEDIYGICRLPAYNISIASLNLQNLNVLLPGMFGPFDAQIESTLLNAQIGRWNGKENYISGDMSLWGNTLTVPSDGLGLAPTFDSIAFEKSYTDLKVNPTLKQPISYDCDFDRFVAVNAARLLVLNSATITREIFTEKLKSQAECGFSSNSVLTKPIDVKGKAGEQGSMTLQVTNCSIGTDTLIPYKCVGNSDKCPAVADFLNADDSWDCNENRTWIQGKATVLNAEMQVAGLRNTYSLYRILYYDAIYPNSPEATHIKLLDVNVDNFAAFVIESESKSPIGKLILVNGSLSTTVTPVLAPSKTFTGRIGTPPPPAEVFEIPTPNADFTNLNFDGNATLQIHDPAEKNSNEQIEHTFKMVATNINAQNGMYGGFGNTLSGTVKIGEKEIKLEGYPLDPSYNQEVFDKSYQCDPNLKKTSN